MLKYICLTLFCLLFPACSTSKVEKSINAPIWKNLHEGDPSLAGVEISQCPEGAVGESEKAYLNGHPAMVLYYFWNKRVRHTGYESNGEVIEDFYWTDLIKTGDAIWDRVDFNLGSDPTFSRHRDPRLK